jgi:hypothetical protein
VVTARQARLVMEVTLAADLSAARNEPVSLGVLAPLFNARADAAHRRNQPIDQG